MKVDISEEEFFLIAQSVSERYDWELENNVSKEELYETKKFILKWRELGLKEYDCEFMWDE